MRHSMNVILTVVVTCSLVLTVQHSILAQVKSKQKSQRNMRKTKEITPISGVERYKAVIQNNLFMPLGSGGEVKREEFALIGTMGRAAFIQMKGSERSFYVAEGQSFGNDAKLVQVGEKSATIIHEGNKKELKLVSGTLISQSGGAKGGRTRQRQGNSGKSSKKMETARRSEKERGSRSGKQGGDTNWARKMSMDELGKVRGQIERHIEGLRAKGVRDPKEYEGAYKKMEMVDRAMDEK